MSQPSVSVLMSTYNGSKYIREQIESILNQKGVDVKLLIRDDGSKDDTLAICREYEKQYPNVSVYQGENLGVGKSFLELLRKAPEADYYSFADQDDFWLEEKLISAVTMIQEAESKDLSRDIGEGYPITADALSQRSASADKNKVPVLYGSNLIRVDERLQVKGKRFDGIPKCDLYSSITRNIIYGCTMVMNGPLREVCNKAGIPSDMVLRRKNHDGWVLYLAYISGVFVYDTESYIHYREHTSQVVGIRELKGKDLLLNRVQRLTKAKNKGVRSTLAKELLQKMSGAMKPQVRRHLETLRDANSIRGSISLVKDKELAASFGEKKSMIVLRGLLRWI